MQSRYVNFIHILWENRLAFNLLVSYFMAYLRYKVDETALFYDRLSNIRKSRKKRKSSPLNVLPVCVHMRKKVLEDKLLIDAFSLPPCSLPWDQSFFGKPKEFTLWSKNDKKGFFIELLLFKFLKYRPSIQCVLRNFYLKSEDF